MRRTILIVSLLCLLQSVYAADNAASFRTLAVGLDYSYSAIEDGGHLNYHGPGIVISNMNSIGNDGIYIYENASVDFPLFLSYGNEIRDRSGFKGITSFNVSIGAGWSGRSGILRYFIGGGASMGLLAFDVRCGSLLDIDIGVEAEAGFHFLMTDFIFLECALKASYSFADFQNVNLSSYDYFASSWVNGFGVSGRIALGFDF